MQKNSKFHWLIDNGHGGFIDGEYVTAPAKMFKHENGPTVYEGRFNRQIALKIAYLLNKNDISFDLLVPEEKDISLNERKKRVDYFANSCGLPTCLVSIHGNAGKGTGFEVFTTKGQTISDPIAEIFIEEIAKEFPTERKRVDITDGDQDKEANFSILMCKGAAILTENFFMDNLKDAKLMLSEEGQSKIAKAHVAAILRIEAGGVEAPKKKAKSKTKKK